MYDFVNAGAYATVCPRRIRKGIVLPTGRIFHVGTDLYRFGDDREKALYGSWWLERSQMMLVRD